MSGAVVSKSLDFVKQRYGKANWANSIEINAENIFNGVLREVIPDADCEKNVLRVEINDKHYDVHFRFDNDADFDYYTIEQSVNDSTMAFAVELFKKIVAKVISLQTCYKPYEHGDFEEIYWTIGNFVYLGEKCEPQRKPWLNYSMTVLLPLKMEVK